MEKQTWSKADIERMPVVIISLHEKWWYKIAAGEKLLEIRKNKPARPGPFKVLAYITGTGCIYGQFVCPEVLEVKNYEEIAEKSKVPIAKLHEYGKGKKLAGWKIENVTEFITPQPLALYEMKRPPQAWCYYNGAVVPDLMTINNFANICGYFYNAEFDPEATCTPNNGYNCRHPEQEESYGGTGCCYQWSCPLACSADEEDCEKYGIEYEESEFVLVQRG